VALGLFIAAAITDFLDGYLARLWSQQSSLGRMLDPIADKLLVAAVLLMLAAVGTIAGVHLWAAIIILCREVLVSGLREFLGQVQASVPVTQLAKYKTAVQLVAIGFLIAGPAGDRILPYTTEIGLAGLWIAALLTLYTGLRLLPRRHQASDGGGRMKVLYFAWVRQRTGIGEEDVEVPAGVDTVGDLMDWLKDRHEGYRSPPSPTAARSAPRWTRSTWPSTTRSRAPAKWRSSRR
jgi:cardiolipin synthase (CMP-forming)